MKALLPMLVCLYLFGCGAGDGTGLDQDGQPIDPDSSDPAPQPPVDPDALQPTLASIQEKDRLTFFYLVCPALRVPGGLLAGEVVLAVGDGLLVGEDVGDEFA